MVIGNKTFKDTGTYIMGILNVTPDSFYDGGQFDDMDSALYQAEQMMRDGADIIDIGGESTRPGHEPISCDEEMERVIPVLTEIKKRIDIPVSVDTYRSTTAKEAIAAGADMINDIWGLNYAGNDVSMADVVGESGVAVCIMHNNTNMYKADIKDKKAIQDNLSHIISDVRASVDMARAHGIKDEKIIIDPGVGFAKDYAMNMAVMANIDRFVELGYPVLLGASNKSVIGDALDVPVEERLFGTVATSVYAATKGVRFVRVHDIIGNRHAVLMADKLLDVRVW